MKKFMNPELDINKFDREAILTSSSSDIPDTAQTKIDEWADGDSSKSTGRFDYWGFSF